MLLCVSNLNPRRNVSSNLFPVIVGRLLVGFAVGTITGVAPVFGAEIAKVRMTFDKLSCSRG